MNNIQKREIVKDLLVEVSIVILVMILTLSMSTAVFMLIP